MFYFSQTRNLGIDTLSTACESSQTHHFYLRFCLWILLFIFYSSMKTQLNEKSKICCWGQYVIFLMGPQLNTVSDMVYTLLF